MSPVCGIFSTIFDQLTEPSPVTDREHGGVGRVEDRQDIVIMGLLPTGGDLRGCRLHGAGFTGLGVPWCMEYGAVVKDEWCRVHQRRLHL